MSLSRQWGIVHVQSHILSLLLLHIQSQIQPLSHFQYSPKSSTCPLSSTAPNPYPVLLQHYTRVPRRINSNPDFFFRFFCYTISPNFSPSSTPAPVCKIGAHTPGCIPIRPRPQGGAGTGQEKEIPCDGTGSTPHPAPRPEAG